jgi:hypothetical protein
MLLGPLDHSGLLFRRGKIKLKLKVKLEKLKSLLRRRLRKEEAQATSARYLVYVIMVFLITYCFYEGLCVPS